MKKSWIENRQDELMIKTRVKELNDIEYPDIDMDGCHFHPELTEEQELRYYDYMASSSRRLSKSYDKFLYDNQFELMESYK